MAQLGQKKSRKGCIRCKQRRVKCDEDAPCSNCTRRNEECSLLEPSPSSSETPREPGIPSNTEEWLTDLELMHHYGTSAGELSLGVQPGLREMWANYLPQQALQHPFLMHGILAFSALHLAYLHQYRAPKYLQLSDKHQAIALKEFRRILASEIEEGVANALFALSATISVSSMARACASAELAPGEPKAMTMEDVGEYFFLTRGVRDVIHVTYDSVRNGPLGALFDSHRMPEGTIVTLPTEVQDQFSALGQMVATWGLDPEALTHCQSALSDLEEIYCNTYYWATHHEVYVGQVIRWITMVTTGYVRLVQARNQPALVIFAYFAAATSAVRTAFYIQNWGLYALRGLSLELDESMLPWVHWPARQLEDRMSILGVQLTQEEAAPVKPMFGPE